MWVVAQIIQRGSWPMWVVAQIIQEELANVSSCTNHPERKLAIVSSCTNHPEEAGQYINPITLYASILVLQYSDWYSYKHPWNWTECSSRHSCSGSNLYSLLQIAMASQWTVTLLVSLLALFGFSCAAGKHSGCKSIAWFVGYWAGLPCSNMCEWMYCYVLDSIVQLQNTKSNIFQVGLGGMYLNYGLIEEVMQGVVTFVVR